MCKSKGGDDLFIGWEIFFPQRNGQFAPNVYARDVDFLLYSTMLISFGVAVPWQKIGLNFFTKTSLNKSKELN